MRVREEIICNERSVSLFWHCVDLAIRGEWGYYETGGSECFTDYLKASEYHEEYENHGTVCGHSGAAACVKMLDVMVGNFIHDVDKRFISVRKPVHASKKLRLVGVEMLGESADLIYRFCKANNCDPSYAVATVFGGASALPENHQPITAQEQIIANAVADMIDKRFGSRMAEIEMTMGLIGQDQDHNSQSPTNYNESSQQSAVFSSLTPIDSCILDAIINEGKSALQLCQASSIRIALENQGVSDSSSIHEYVQEALNNMSRSGRVYKWNSSPNCVKYKAHKPEKDIF